MKRRKVWKVTKDILYDIFVDGMTGMAYGLFATLIIGTIMLQIGRVVPGVVGDWISVIAETTRMLTGAGIGVGIAYRFREHNLVTVSAAVCGFVGAYANQMIAGTFIHNGAISVSGPGEPLGAFAAAYIGVKLGHLVSRKTKIDILVTPIVTICTGCAVGLMIGPSISRFMLMLGSVIIWATDQQPALMGALVAVLVGSLMTLPVSSAAICVILDISGISAGAATVGCCCNMIGFAVASFKDNGWGGFLAQSIGTSMLQIGNVMKKPVLWLIAVIPSAILGPVSTVVLGMTNDSTGAGMGTAGLVGQITTYQSMTSAGFHGVIVILEILIMHFTAPAVLSFIVAEIMRKTGILKDGDLKLET